MKANKIIYIFVSLMLSCGLLSCSDETFEGSLDYDEPVIVLDAGTMSALSTRAAMNEDEIGDVWIGIYDKSGSLLLSQSVLSADMSGGSEKSVRLHLTSAVKNAAGGLTMYMVANRGDKMSLSGNESELLSIVDDISLSSMAMWAKTEVSSYKDIAGKRIVLSRNRGKLSVECDPSSVGMENFKIKKFYLCYGQSEGKIISEALQEGSDIIEADGGEFGYSFPVSNNGEKPLRVVVYGGYGEDSYYCANFEKRGDAGELIPLDFNSNTWYQMKLQNASSNGYPTLQAALESGASLEAVISDHHPDIFNMVKSGDKELGVSDTIRWNDNNIYSFYIKTTSSGSEKPYVTIDESCKSWIFNALDSNRPYVDITGPVLDKSGTESSIWTGTLVIDRSVSGEPRLGYINVSWEGLSATIVVEQKHTIDSKIEVTLKYTDGNGIYQTLPSEKGYFSFIEGVDDKNTYERTDKLYGIRPSQNGGLVRNEGLHFPMGLKQTDNETDVKYQYTLNPTVSGSAGLLSKMSYTVEVTDEWFKKRLNFSRTSGSANNPFTITWNGSADDKEYRVAKNALKVIYTYNYFGGDKRTAIFYYDLYHTGFFFKHTDIKSYDRSGKTMNGWHYYEVIPVSDNGKTRLWLDRNIGARASGVYVNNNGVNEFAGAEGTWPYNASSVGGLMSVMKPGYETVGGVIPSGFRVPSVNEWNDYAAGSGFSFTNIYEFGKSYWSANYQLGDKKVYFPKAGLIKAGGSSNNSGTSKTGYYWTHTEALGAAGTGAEAGKWVQIVKFENSTRSFERQRVVEGDSYIASEALGMSLRCVDDVADETRLMRINFAVKGYTHLYLYYIDRHGNRVGINSWPGDMVIPSVANTDRYQEYTLTTYMDIPLKFYAILTTVNSGGNVEYYHDAEGRHGYMVSSPDGMTGIECDKSAGSGNRYIRLPER